MWESLKKRIDQLGVTLIEMLAVISILGFVIAAIVVLNQAVYNTYNITATQSQNQREATAILSQLTEQIHAAPKDADHQAVTLDDMNHSIRITTSLSPFTQVTYQSSEGKIIYTSANGAQMTLTEHGSVSISQIGDGDTYTITVTIGKADKNQATQTTTITRYDWGNS